MKHTEEQDPLWDLLKLASKTEVRPTFAQDVAREARRLGVAPVPERQGWLWARWGAAVAAATALLVGGWFLAVKPSDRTGEIAAPVVEVDSPPPRHEITLEEFAAELDELAYMSELFDVPDPSLLPDEELAALLF